MPTRDPAAAGVATSENHHGRAPELRAFELGSADEGDRSALRALLSVMIASDRARALRVDLVHASAVMGAPLWACAMWPGWVLPALRNTILGAWIMLVVATTAAALCEASLRNRQKRLLSNRGERQGD